MVATAELTLDDASDNIRTHDLKIENSGTLFLYFCQIVSAFFIPKYFRNVFNHVYINLFSLNSGNGRHQLPLFGHFCCRLAAQPICMTQETYSSVVYIPESLIKSCNITTKDRRNWVKCWAQLLAFKLKFWATNGNQAEDREPDYCIDINRVNVEFNLHRVLVTVNKLN